MNIAPFSITCVEVVKVVRGDPAAATGLGRAGEARFQGDIYLSSVSAETTPDTQLQVWVKNLDGSEERLDFHNIDVPVHDGDKLALLRSGIKVWGIKNFASGTTTAFAKAGDLMAPREAARQIPVKSSLIVVVFLVGLNFIGRQTSWTLDERLGALILLVVVSFIFDYRLHRRRWDYYNYDLAVHEGHKVSSFKTGRMKPVGPTTPQKLSFPKLIMACLIGGAVLCAAIYFYFMFGIIGGVRELRLHIALALAFLCLIVIAVIGGGGRRYLRLRARAWYLGTEGFVAPSKAEFPRPHADAFER